MLSTFVICFLNQINNACIKSKDDEIEPFKLCINENLKFEIDFNQTQEEYTQQMYQISEQISNKPSYFFKFEKLSVNYVKTELKNIKVKENQRMGINIIIEMYKTKYKPKTDIKQLNTFDNLRNIANIIVVCMKNEKITSPAFKLFEDLKDLHAYEYSYNFNLRCIEKSENQKCIKEFKEYYNKYLVIYNAVENQLPRCAEFRSKFVNPKTNKMHSHDSRNSLKYVKIIEQPIVEMLKEQFVKNYYESIIDIKENIKNIKDAMMKIKSKHNMGEYSVLTY